MCDCTFLDKVEAFHDMVMAYECDIRGHALDFFMIQWLDNNLGEDKEEILEKVISKTEIPIQELISIKQAWHEFLIDEGLRNFPPLTIRWRNLMSPLIV